MVKPRIYPLPDFGDVIFLLVVNLLVFALPHFMLGDGSTGWHLVTGKFILETHRIPTQDLMSYTFPGAPWVAYEWLFDLFAAFTEKLAGLNGLVVACSSIIALVMLLVYERCRRAGANFPLAAFLVIVGSLASSVHWLARPHIFTILGVFIFAATLESFQRDKISKSKMLGLLSVSMAFWVNLHPGFMLGFALTIIYLASALATGILVDRDTGGGEALTKAKWFGATMCTLLAASMLNPYGPQLFNYIGHYLQSSEVLHATNEFASPVFHGQIQQSCLEIIFLLVVVGLAMTKKSPSFPQLLSCLAFGHLALSGIRNAPVFVVVALPFIADLFSQVRLPFSSSSTEPTPVSWLAALGTRFQKFCEGFDQNEESCQMHILPVVAVIVLMIAAANSGSLFGEKILICAPSARTMPTTTLDYIRDHKLEPKQGFNYDNWGGYICYRLGIPVFIDDRLDFYGKKFYFDYGAIVQLEPGWEKLLDKYKIGWIIFPKDNPLSRQLKVHTHWKLLCQDEAAALFQRSD